MPREADILARIAAVAALIFGLSLAEASAEKRVALVIGNGAYVAAPALKNPVNDARALSARLRELGFDVIEGLDLDEPGMRAAINRFASEIAAANAALLFYAGHGIQVGGQNYLLPVTADLKNEIDLQFQGVAVGFLLRIMESPNRTAIVLLDACRNNPLAAQLARSMPQGRSASVGAGLARIESGVGAYIGFATSPDSIALDGEGDHSPFAQALLKHIGAENLDIEAVMRKVREEVIAATNGSQVPWGNSSLIGRGFVFRVAEIARAEPPRPLPVDNETLYWQSIVDQTKAEYFEAYLAQYPDGAFANLARLKIGELKAQDNAAARGQDNAAAKGGDSVSGESAAGSKAKVDTKVAAVDPSAGEESSKKTAPEAESKASFKLNSICRQWLATFRRGHKGRAAFAAAANGSCGWSAGGLASAQAAAAQALSECRKQHPQCKVIATK